MSDIKQETHTHWIERLLKGWGINTHLLHYGFRAWFIEIVISGLNFFLLMNLIYEPRWGYLRAHQIGMSTRIIYIFVIAYFLLRYVKSYKTKDLAHVGLFWLGLTLLFEWGGSFIIRRPVSEIVEGWNIFAGFMWPYVLLAYFTSNFIVGVLFHPGKEKLTATGHALEPSPNDGQFRG